MKTKTLSRNSRGLKSLLRMFVITIPMVTMSSMLNAQTVLDAYIQEGLKSNLVLQQKTISWEQAQQSLQVARSFFLPSVNLLTDYTSGEGGRSISMPIGDLLNPVYASLNQIT
ncbi:MAG TPA: TolC family protein, partial [Chryseolinea sp.]|nr:TolC family protein [Chryseolinea sp.]